MNAAAYTVAHKTYTLCVFFTAEAARAAFAKAGPKAAELETPKYGNSSFVVSK